MDLTLPLAFLLFLAAGEVLLFRIAWTLFGPRDRADKHLSPLYVTFVLAGQVVFPLAWAGMLRGWSVLDRVTQADVLAVSHFSFAVMVVLVQLLVLVGWALGWRWVRNYWLRVAHLLAILFVTLQTAVDYECPFTTWERELRGGELSDLAGASAIGHFCNRALYTKVENLTPMLIRYVSFAALVIASWYFAPPRWPGVVDEEEKEGPDVHRTG